MAGAKGLWSLSWRDFAEDPDVWSLLHEGSSVGSGAGMLGDVQGAFIPLPPSVGLMMGKGRECTFPLGSGLRVMWDLLIQQ